MPSLKRWINELLDDLARVGDPAAARQRLDRRELIPALKGTPRSTVHALDPCAPRVGVEGHARALKTTTAPLSGEQVIGYRIQIYGRGRHVYPSIHVDRSHLEAFALVDQTGSALVRGGHNVLLARPRSFPELLFDPDNTGLARLIESAGYSSTDLVGARRLSCIERVLRSDGEVFVCGAPEAVVGVGEGAPGYREPPGHVALGPPAGQRLIVADCQLGALLGSLKQRGAG
jgi:hypothetical protein